MTERTPRPDLRDHDRRSLWHGTAEVTSYPALSGDHDTEVVVVGGGVTGLTTALLLAEAGVDVTVLEARHLAAGATGGTTGKVTSQHGVIYRDLIERHGEDTARVYAEVNQAAIGQVAAICDRHGIDAAWTPADAYVYAVTEDEVAELRREETAARTLGLPADWVETTELPFDVHGALRFTDQAQYHAVAYVEGLARAIAAHPHARVHCGTRVTGVTDSGDRVVAETPTGRVNADHAVLATLLPITDRGFEFARARASRTYGIAAVVDGALPEGMYISAGEPGRSIRHYHADEAAYLVVVGDAHEVGHDRETARHLRALEDFARTHYEVRDVAYRWSAQDYVPDDRLPFIGRTAWSERIHVATGFQKWGLTNGTAAARILTRTITGDGDPAAEVFAPTRTNVTASAKQFLQHNLDVAARFTGDRVTAEVDSVDEIPPGGGATVRIDGRLRAASRDDDGRVTIRSAVCTHLGCVVAWNESERSWDCPCHGSRFDDTGEVLEGPATRALAEG